MTHGPDLKKNRKGEWKLEYRPTTYKQLPAHKLRHGDLTLLVTDYGAKIQSIRFRGKEMLCQSFNTSDTYRISDYAAHFEEGEFSGFDHLFPNISAADYPDGPWQGIRLPDHGEVWTQVFRSDYTEDTLTFSTNGIRLPYRFSVAMRLRDNALVLTYEAENLTPYPMKYLWCCHPLFVLEDGMELQLPGCTSIINTAPGQKYLGDYLEEHLWPLSNEGRDMSRLHTGNRCCNKYYVRNPRQRNEARLVYPDGTTVTIEADAEKAPYMGIWVDELGYGQYAMACAAPEPASAALDSYGPADRYQMNSILPPQEKLRWDVTITFR